MPEVLHQLPEPAAPQYGPHGQQALQLRRLWQKLLPGSHAEETPAHSLVDAAFAQARTQTGASRFIVFLSLRFKGPHPPISRVKNRCFLCKIAQLWGGIFILIALDRLVPPCRCVLWTMKELPTSSHVRTAHRGSTQRTSLITTSKNNNSDPISYSAFCVCRSVGGNSWILYATF